jgi:hypothetical protein
VPKFGRVVQWVISLSVSGAAAAVHAQNLDAGKSPAQIFSDNCNACYRSPRLGLRRVSCRVGRVVNFRRELPGHARRGALRRRQPAMGPNQ